MLGGADGFDLMAVEPRLWIEGWRSPRGSMSKLVSHHVKRASMSSFFLRPPHLPDLGMLCATG
jgi:hypothetical protein